MGDDPDSQQIIESGKDIRETYHYRVLWVFAISNF